MFNENSEATVVKPLHRFPLCFIILYIQHYRRKPSNKNCTTQYDLYTVAQRLPVQFAVFQKIYKFQFELHVKYGLY
jgi:hypothetical protein